MKREKKNVTSSNVEKRKKSEKRAPLLHFFLHSLALLLVRKRRGLLSQGEHLLRSRTSCKTPAVAHAAPGGRTGVRERETKEKEREIERDLLFLFFSPRLLSRQLSTGP